MPSKDILQTWDLCIEQSDWIYAVKPLSRDAVMLDPVEYGMGFERGELDAFIDSQANEVLLQEGMDKAFDDGKWVLVPESEHLKYLVQLWSDNLLCAPSLRERYIPPQEDLGKSRSGCTLYPYSFFRLESYNIYHLDGTLVQNGARVWSSIPPYIWLVIGGCFVQCDGQDSDLPACLTPQKSRLRDVDDMLQVRVPYSFITSRPEPDRPDPIREEVDEARLQNAPHQTLIVVERCGVEGDVGRVQTQEGVGVQCLGWDGLDVGAEDGWVVRGGRRGRCGGRLGGVVVDDGGRGRAELGGRRSFARKEPKDQSWLEGSGVAAEADRISIHYVTNETLIDKQRSNIIPESFQPLQLSHYSQDSPLLNEKRLTSVSLAKTELHAADTTTHSRQTPFHKQRLTVATQLTVYSLVIHSAFPRSKARWTISPQLSFTPLVILGTGRSGGCDHVAPLKAMFERDGDSKQRGRR
ncbi:hypothetical protein E4T56_gene1022 [Termitomyces sp. T112]|nr:hypothetical protein E4T56_gene1022 [Termitomyces sp. T112]